MVLSEPRTSVTALYDNWTLDEEKPETYKLGGNTSKRVEVLLVLYIWFPNDSSLWILSWISKSALLVVIEEL